MKNFTVVIAAVLFLILSVSSYSQQLVWDKIQRITSGHIDRNPSFDPKNPGGYGRTGSAFLVFERAGVSPNSDICVMKFFTDSASQNILYLTNNNKPNRKPKIAWDPTYAAIDSINTAIAVWETVENSRVNIYGSTYNSNQWSAPYPIDTGAGVKSSVNLSYDSGVNFLLVYENNGDIIFKKINAFTHDILYNINLTDTDSAVCKNPTVNGGGIHTPYIVAYQRQKTDGSYAVYCKKTTSNYQWTGDTISVAGNNINPINGQGFSSDIIITYESNKGGKYNIYGYDTYQNNYFTLISNPYFNLSNAQNYLNPFITENMMPYYFMSFGCVLKQANDGMKIMFSYSFPNFIDSVLVSDTLHKPVVTMGNGVKPSSQIYYYMVWTVFNKDSAGVSMLYAYGKKIFISAIQRTGTEIPGMFALYQNFPNPFNPVTIIYFDVPQQRQISLRVFDILGKEKAVLVNEVKPAGSYSVTFDASNLPSGVYFYKLDAGAYSDVKKMILVK